VILGLALVLLWQLWIGSVRPGSTGSPAGDAGLCLALTCWWAGGSAAQGLVVWILSLLGITALSGVSPLWGFLLGWPAWLLVRTLARGQKFPVFLGLAVGLVSLFRCGGKLLLAAGFASPLTLSGPTLPASLWAEMAPNLLFLVIFAWLTGGRRPWLGAGASA
jgi:hypothetical protein